MYVYPLSLLLFFPFLNAAGCLPRPSLVDLIMWVINWGRALAGSFSMLDRPVARNRAYCYGTGCL
jgi:hypothetical protein